MVRVLQNWEMAFRSCVSVLGALVATYLRSVEKTFQSERGPESRVEGREVLSGVTVPFER